MVSRERELSRFGLVVGGLFLLLALWLLSRSGANSPPGMVLALTGTLLVLLGLLAPGALGPTRRIWMGVAAALGRINTCLILGVIFYILFTATRLFLLLFGKDPMGRRRDPALSSYWVDLPDGPADARSYENPF